MRPVLVHIDRSPATAEAVEAALAVAGGTKPPIVLVYASPDPSAARPAELFGAEPNLRRTGLERQREARQQLARHDARLRRRGATVTTVIADSSPAEAMLHAARRFDAGLVVFTGSVTATHGLDPESERLLRLSPCPVLFVRRTALPRAVTAPPEPPFASPPSGDRATRPLLRAPSPRKTTPRPPKRK